jgi:prevent-host-death family protein
MQQIGIRNLKNQVTEILRMVRESQMEYVVTYRGEAVALLLPLAEEKQVGNRVPVKNDSIPYYYTQIAELARLRPQNRRALTRLEEWLSEPLEMDEAAWQLFEQDLEQQRPTFSA